MTTRAYAAPAADQPLGPWTLERRDLRADDVALDILFCGVCHTDMHYARNDWGTTTYPLVPGHEIVGRVTAVGPDVTRHAVGDLVGVGCLVDSCRACAPCRGGHEQYCAERPVLTYNGADRHDGARTFGGYSERIVVSDRFVLRVPEGMDPAQAAPLLCAGITTYAPLRRFGVAAGHRVGVVGMGGLGHLGIKLAKAMGAEVTLFTRSEAKRAEALANGADHVIVSADPAAMAGAEETLDLVLDTVPVAHDLNPYIGTLRFEGTYVLVGQLTPIEPALAAGGLVRRGRVLAGSLIGGLPQTQEVLDFCAEHGVTCDIERIRMDEIEAAYARLARGDVRYRFVIDMATI